MVSSVCIWCSNHKTLLYCDSFIFLLFNHFIYFISSFMLFVCLFDGLSHTPLLTYLFIYLLTKDDHTRLLFILWLFDGLLMYQHFVSYYITCLLPYLLTYLQRTTIHTYYLLYAYFMAYWCISILSHTPLLAYLLTYLQRTTIHAYYLLYACLMAYWCIRILSHTPLLTFLYTPTICCLTAIVLCHIPSRLIIIVVVLSSFTAVLSRHNVL